MDKTCHVDGFYSQPNVIATVRCLVDITIICCDDILPVLLSRSRWGYSLVLNKYRRELVDLHGPFRGPITTICAAHLVKLAEWINVVNNHPSKLLTHLFVPLFKLNEVRLLNNLIKAKVIVNQVELIFYIINLLKKYWVWLAEWSTCRSMSTIQITFFFKRVV